jgi:hypothetical protein
MIRRSGIPYALVALALLAGSSLYGQRKDFNSWYVVEVSSGLKSGIGLSAEFEQRLKNNSTSYDRTMLTLGADYGLADFLKVAAGARVLMVSDRESRITPEYRLHADATGRTRIWDVDLSFRARIQYGFEDFPYFNMFSDNTLVNRYRLKAAYHIFGTPVELFGTAEIWGRIASPDGLFFKKMRYSAGLYYNVNYQSELGLTYILEDEFNQVNPLQSHIIVLSYHYSF